MLPDPVRIAVTRYLQLADRLLPDRIAGFYVVGSSALGAFRDGRSDIDFVAVLDRSLSVTELRKLRLLHVLSAARTSSYAVSRGHSPLTYTCNGVFILAEDLCSPVTEIRPFASQCGHTFSIGRAFDVNPVIWKVFADSGIAVRGPEPEKLGLITQPETLRSWNLENLESYWRPWAEGCLSGSQSIKSRLHPRWMTAWGVLGAPRLHCTISTGEVIPKVGGGQYALATFGAQWHPIVQEGLAYWEGRRSQLDMGTAARLQLTGSFVLEVVRSAHSLSNMSA
jgi:hypothetical protein